MERKPNRTWIIVAAIFALLNSCLCGITGIAVAAGGFSLDEWVQTLAGTGLMSFWLAVLTPLAVLIVAGLAVVFGFLAGRATQFTAHKTTNVVWMVVAILFVLFNSFLAGFLGASVAAGGYSLDEWVQTYAGTGLMSFWLILVSPLMTLLVAALAALLGYLAGKGKKIETSEDHAIRREEHIVEETGTY